jgi:hypothetical protein
MSTQPDRTVHLPGSSRVHRQACFPPTQPTRCTAGPRAPGADRTSPRTVPDGCWAVAQATVCGVLPRQIECTNSVLIGVLNPSTGEAKARVEQAELLAPRRSLTGEPEQLRELRVRTRPDGTVTLNGKLDPEGGARVLEVLNSLNGRRPPVNSRITRRSDATRYRVRLSLV